MDRIQYEKALGLGSTDTLFIDDGLPIAINSDTSIYILFNSNKNDTLGISYIRKIKYTSNVCGFTISLDSFRLLEISTFNSAEFETHNYLNTNETDYEIYLYR
jgi:hypothetical protein